MVRSDLPISVLSNDQARIHLFPDSHRCTPAAGTNDGIGDSGISTMTEKNNLRRDIDALKASIQLDLHELDGRLSADERLVIKDHLDMLITDLQTLLKRLGS
jgi:hypothetical protein